jgi:hypothetical protein
MPVYVDRAKMTSATVGTGTLTLGSAVSGFQSFAAAGVVDQASVRYVIENLPAWEIGLGTYTAAGTTLTRAPIASSAGGGAIACTGAQIVYISAAAVDFTALQTAAQVTTAVGTETTRATGIEATKAPIANPTFSAGLFENWVAVPAANINLATASFFTLTIAAATTLTVSNVPAAPAAASFVLELTNGGAFAITWWANMKWAGGTAPTLTAAGIDVLGFYTITGGTAWRGLVLGKAVA